MRIVIGLGNPGPRYARTRHNVGWRAVTAFAAKLRAGFHPDGPLGTRAGAGGGADAEIARGRAAGEEILIVRPMTYMNLSGYPIRRLAARHGVEPDDLLVVYDDVALPLGRLRLRERGSSGGHRGMESIIETLGTEEIPRLRMGILGEGPRRGDLADYVLEEFAPAEETAVEEMVGRAAEALSLALRRGIGIAAGEINRRERADREMGENRKDPEKPEESKNDESGSSGGTG